VLENHPSLLRIYLWTGGVKMAISTFEILPHGYAFTAHTTVAPSPSEKGTT
jgi:hypothetical protein